LELRKLATGMYADAVGPTLENYLFLFDRINTGASEDDPTVNWRYACKSEHEVKLTLCPNFCLIPCSWKMYC
jgi:hypothetical protein